jgi:hypothetical protein
MSSDQGFGADRHDLGCRVVQPEEQTNLAGLALQALGRVFRRGERASGADQGAAALARIAGTPRGSAGARN